MSHYTQVTTDSNGSLIFTEDPYEFEDVTGLPDYTSREDIVAEIEYLLSVVEDAGYRLNVEYTGHRKQKHAYTLGKVEDIVPAPHPRQQDLWIQDSDGCHFREPGTE